MSDLDPTTYPDTHTDQVPARRPSQGRTAAERLGGPGEAGRETPAGPGPAGGERPATLIPTARAEGYRERWNELKGEFVDDPRHAVRGANAMVGELLDDLEELFRTQRDDIERGLDGDGTTTEDLRLALGRYRSFFDRLLSF